MSELSSHVELQVCLQMTRDVENERAAEASGAPPVAAYGFDLLDFRRCLPSGKEPEDVTIDDLKGYLSNMVSERALSPSTVRRRIAWLSQQSRSIDLSFSHTAAGYLTAVSGSHHTQMIWSGRQRSRLVSVGRSTTMLHGGRASRLDFVDGLCSTPLRWLAPGVEAEWPTLTATERATSRLLAAATERVNLGVCI
jgi:hypothetical protein